jgi:hypothetical protein
LTICDSRNEHNERRGEAVGKNIRPPNIAAYRNERDRVSPRRANRELAFLSVVFSHGFELGLAGVTTNPVKGVSRAELKHRTRCPTDAEYDAVYKHASEYMQIGMEIAYLCRLRWSEVFGLNDVHDESAPGIMRQHVEEKRFAGDTGQMLKEPGH